MKRSIVLLSAVASLLALNSCGDREANDGKTNVIKDSIATVLPTEQALHIVVSEDRSQMDVVVGDVTFYNASPDEKAKKALQLGQMITRIYGKNSFLEKGSLIVTKDIRNTSDAPKDGISTPINFEELKKGQ